MSVLTILDKKPMRISAVGVWLLLLRRGKDLAGLCGRGPSLLWSGLSRPGNEESCYQQGEDESAHVGGERDAAAVRRQTTEAFQDLSRSCCRRTGPGVGFSRVAASRIRRGRRTRPGAWRRRRGAGGRRCPRSEEH